MRALKYGVSILAGVMGIAQTAGAGEPEVRPDFLFPFPTFHIISGPRSVAVTSSDTVVALTNGEIYAVNQSSGMGRDLTVFSSNTPLAVTGYNTAGFDHVVVATTDGNIWDFAYPPGSTSAVTPRQIANIQPSLGPVEALSAWVDAKGYTNIAILERASAGGLLWLMQNPPGTPSSTPGLLGATGSTSEGIPIDVAGQDSYLGGAHLNQIEVAYSNHIERFSWPDQQTVSLSTVQQPSAVYWPTVTGALSFAILNPNINLSPNVNGIVTSSDLWTWDWDWYSTGYTSVNTPGLTFDQHMSFPASPTSIVGVSQTGAEVIYDVALSNGQVWQVTAPINVPADTVGAGSGHQLFQIF